MDRLEVFKNWFINRFMNDGPKIIALHINNVQPRYRDGYPRNQNLDEPPSLTPALLSAILGAPELAIPSKSMASSYCLIVHSSLHP
jgi:hypothetical protein